MAARPVGLTIGVPVYNEAIWIEQSLRSLLCQEYQHFKLLVCDNCSTDATAEIVARIASQDSRVELVRAERNLGAAANFQRALDLAEGEYFAWAAGHDLWSPNYFNSCIGLLESRKEMVLAVGSSAWIDCNGECMPRAVASYSTLGMPPVSRFICVLLGNMHPIYGVHRLANLRSLGEIPRMVGADLHLLTELAWQGEFGLAKDAIWYRREIHPPERYADKLARYQSQRYALAVGVMGRVSPLLPVCYSLMRQGAMRPQGWSRRLFLALTLPGLMALRYLDRP